MCSRLLCIVIFFFASFTLAEAETTAVTILSQKITAFENSSCRKTNTCNLKKATFTEFQYQILIQGTSSYGTSLYAEYETETLSDLEKYVFVQFVRGCVYTFGFGAGSYFGVSREHLGKITRFQHKEWTVDSIDRDPSYFSVPGKGRHYAYRWKQPGETFPDTSAYELFGQKHPKVPRLFVYDIPSTSFYVNKPRHYGQTASLELNMCMFRSEDVPHEYDPLHVYPEKALFCHRWSNMHKPDFARARTLKSNTLEPFCFSP